MIRVESFIVNHMDCETARGGIEMMSSLDWEVVSTSVAPYGNRYIMFVVMKERKLTLIEQIKLVWRKTISMIKERV